MGNIYREREGLHAEIILLKSEKASAEKEVMIARDNADRMKRKYEMSLHQLSTEMEQIKIKNDQLEVQRVELMSRIERLQAAEAEFMCYRAKAEKNMAELHKLRQ